MSAELRGPAYRAALSEAYLELDEICERIAQLRTRKEQLERASAALQAMMGERQVQAQPLEEQAHAKQEVAPPAPVYQMPTTERRREVSSDPLQRHIDQALGMAALA